MRYLMGVVIGLFVTLPVLAQDNDSVLVLTLMGTNSLGDSVPTAHFYIEPESGVWGVAGSWTYWDDDGWYLYRDETAIYRVTLSTGEEQQLSDVPPEAILIDVAVSPDGEWVAFITTMADPFGLSVYVVRIDGSDQRRLLHKVYAERVWSLEWDDQTLEIGLQPIYYMSMTFKLQLDGSITADSWYNVSPDSQWMAWRVWGFNYESYIQNIATGEKRMLSEAVDMSPIWTTDSQWILYMAGEHVYRESLDGRVIEPITQLPSSYNIWWGPAHEWLYVNDNDKQLYRVRHDQLGSDLQLVPGQS